MKKSILFTTLSVALAISSWALAHGKSPTLALATGLSSQLIQTKDLVRPSEPVRKEQFCKKTVSDKQPRGTLILGGPEAIPM